MSDRGGVLLPALVLAVLGALLYLNPAGIRDAVLTGIMDILGTYGSLVIVFVLVGVTIALMVYFLMRIIKPW